MSQESAFWKIYLFGGPYLEGGGRVIKKFRSAKCASLLGYLALNHEKPCSREALIEALWPGETDMAVLANRFRVTLASLRKQLEPEGFPFGSVLDTSLPGCVSLARGATRCDVSEFEKAYAAGDLTRASGLLSAPLLPGLYDGWAADAQLRYQLLLDELPRAAESGGEPSQTFEAEALRHQLPRFLSAFFGREEEARFLGHLMESHRLVTVTGPGGVGKTRLAIEACRGSGRRTVFVPLTDCVDWDSLLDTTIRQFSVAGQNTPDSYVQLVEVLKTQGPLRLLLDNADHLIEETCRLIESLLNEFGDLHILVTSRQALDLDGEQIFRTQPFTVAVEGEVEDDASVKLFLDRLRQSRPDFSASASQLRLIREICVRLEGLPLALELAAAQINVLSLSEIADQLKISLTELRSKRRTIVRRHHTIRLAIESSFVGLDERTQAFLSQISVFWGGFTARQASEVTGERDPLARLEDLVQRSLLSATPTDRTVRFGCLEVIRQLAQERLPADQLKALLDQHALLFLKYAAEVDEGDLDTLAPLDGEDLNLAAAFQYANPGDPLYWRAKSGAIQRAFIRGQYRTALRWIREEMVPEVAEKWVQHQWLNVAVQVLIDLGLFDQAQSMIAYAQKEAAADGDAHSLTYQNVFKGLLFERMGRQAEGVQLHREALDDARKIGHGPLVECALSHLSGSLRSLANLGDPPDARLLGEASRYAHELLGLVHRRSRRLPLALLLCGATELGLGQLDQAGAHLDQAVNAAKASGLLTVQMFATHHLAEIANLTGQSDRHAVLMKEFRRLKAETGIWNEQWDRAGPAT